MDLRLLIVFIIFFLSKVEYVMRDRDTSQIFMNWVNICLGYPNVLSCLVLLIDWSWTPHMCHNDFTSFSYKLKADIGIHYLWWLMIIRYFHLKSMNPWFDLIMLPFFYTMWYKIMSILREHVLLTLDSCCL